MMASPPQTDKRHSRQGTIRDACAADAHSVVALAQQLAAFEGQPAPRFTAQSFARDVLSQPPRCRVKVLECEGRVVAFMMFYPGYDLATATHGNHLGDLVVDAAYRRSGFGTALLTDLANETLRFGGSWISLTALKSNPQAQAFYKALGVVDLPVAFMAFGERALLKMTSGAMSA